MSNLNFDKMLRHKRIYKFRPFEKAETSAVEIIFVTYIEHLFQTFDSIEIEMED